MSSEDLTAITVVSNLGHPVVSCEDESRRIIFVELREETFRLSDDVVHNLNILHIFLLRALIVNSGNLTPEDDA